MSFRDILVDLNHLSAIAAILATAILVWGFVRLGLKSKGLIRHLALGLLLMHLVVFLRTGYWHIVSFVFPIWKVGFVTQSDIGTAVFLLFNLIVVVAGFFSLKALWLAIPSTVRQDYSLLGAAFYPRGRSVMGRLRSFCRGRGRSGPRD
jgi:hypothetical protein